MYIGGFCDLTYNQIVPGHFLHIPTHLRKPQDISKTCIPSFCYTMSCQQGDNSASSKIKICNGCSLGWHPPTEKYWSAGVINQLKQDSLSIPIRYLELELLFVKYNKYRWNRVKDERYMDNVYCNCEQAPAEFNSWKSLMWQPTCWTERVIVIMDLSVMRWTVTIWPNISQFKILNIFETYSKFLLLKWFSRVYFVTFTWYVTTGRVITSYDM